jgi:excisionase family DNA binding protein
MATSDPSTFLTLQQVVEEYPWLTERWLRRAVHEKKIPFYKVGGRLLFDPAELNQWVRDRHVEPVTTKPAGRRIPRRKKAAS